MKCESRLKNWIAPNDDLLPDFIIGGAMKSGTSTLHEILNQHPKVFIPKNEIHFFDIDNPLQHKDFNFYDKESDRWIYQNMNNNPTQVWDWYLSKYAGKENVIKGEDSTTYLASCIAAERISIQKKKIKLIFLLRQPTMRAYSNYHHLLRTGRATYSFEDTIRFSPHSILNRSLYKEQLTNFYKFIPSERIKVLLFEDFVADTEKVVREVCDYIEIDFNEFPVNVLQTHANKAKLPANINLQIRKNHFMHNFGNTHYVNSLPNKPVGLANSNSSVAKIINAIHNKLNPQIVKKAPKIRDSTKAFLDEYFYQELEGINELINQDVLSKWFPDKQTDTATDLR